MASQAAYLAEIRHMTTSEKEWYRPDELAKAMDISLWTVYRLMRRGIVKHNHLNLSHHSARIPREEFFRMLRKNV